MRKLILLFITVFIFGFLKSHAQVSDTIYPEQLKEYMIQSKQLVNYLEGTLNFIGNKNELPSDKDIIFNNSYLKIFDSEKVQIEDDLDENREMPLNKDVQAYLKDIDFFFKDVRFKFEIEKVDQLVTKENKIVFKLTLNRHLEGITINDDSVNNNQLRFMEVNLNPDQKELKIASIYTTKIREKEELRYWWNNMATEWKDYFGSYAVVYDTLPFNEIIWFTDTSIVIAKQVHKIFTDTIPFVDDVNTDPPIWASDSITILYDTITELQPDTIIVNTASVYNLLRTFRKSEKVDISNNLNILDIEPLSELTELTELDLSYTIISDLKPIRNLKKLEVLNLRGSPVINLLPLRYIGSLKELDVSYTMVDNIEVAAFLSDLTKLNLSNSAIVELANMSYLKSLTQLNISSTEVSNINPISNNKLISDLDISNTDITNIDALDSLTELQHLNIDSTRINDINPLSSCLNLSMLKANSTDIYDLTPLNKLPNLKVIYCDNSKVNTKQASHFMEQNPGCLVIFNSQELVKWWNSLSFEWKSIFIESYDLVSPVTKEQLHTLLNQTYISVANNPFVVTIDPLSMLHNLEKVDISNTKVTDISPISGLNNLQTLKINNSKVVSLEPVSSLHNLKIVDIRNTQIGNISPLLNSPDIKTIYCDDTNIDLEKALEFKDILPEVLIIFQSERLKMWWNGLDETWQNTFVKIGSLSERPTKEELQELVDIQQLVIENNLNIRTLNPLHVFVRLNSLTVNSTSITSIGTITSLNRLEKLDVSKNPIASLESINKFLKLRDLIIRNTSVEDIEPVSKVKTLETLDISGTRVGNLKYMDNLHNLKNLYINNTRIKKLKPLFELNNLELLQCYNTSIKQSRIDEFKKIKPKVEVIYY